MPTQSLESAELSTREIADLSGNPDFSGESKENYRWAERGKTRGARIVLRSSVNTGVSVVLLELA